jgi:serine protease Do
MRKTVCRTTLAMLIGVALGGAGTESRAQYSRRTPIVEAVEKTRDSIVTIKVERQIKGTWGRKEVVGTGVIVDERGYVVTNRHVVTGDDHPAVHLADGTKVAAEVLTEDSQHDLAILKLRVRQKLPALRFGPASDLMIGETVIAIGHPFGYTNTVSTGIISALDRKVCMPGGEELQGLIQTNASINPGNSGGPLLNINGELIGINVALRERAQGIAFALKADTVQEVLSRHLSARRVGHGLGLVEEVVADEGPARQRIKVIRVTDKGPAALRPGDVLLRLGERTVANRFDVERALWGYRPGDRVKAAVLRDRKETCVTLTLDRGSEPEPVVRKAGAGNETRTSAGDARPANSSR